MSENTTTHTLVAKGAAFTDDFARVDPTGTGGIGKAACACGWLSEELPSGKQRMVAHRNHKSDVEFAETRRAEQEAEEEAVEPAEEKAEETADEAVEQPVEESEEAVLPDFVVQRDFLGNYAIEMVPFTRTLAESFGLTVEEQRFKGELRRRANIHGADWDVLHAFLPVLEDAVNDAMAGLKEWQKAHRDERRGKTDQILYVQNRTFLREFGQQRAAEVKP